MIVPPVVFADASYYIALLSRPDADRDRAIAWHRCLAARQITIITTEAVLWEFLNYFSAAPGRLRAMESYERLRADPRTEVVGFDRGLCVAAVQLYKNRPDQNWGVTDCLSFVVMAHRKLTAALTADRHFEQAGFTALLLQAPP